MALIDCKECKTNYSDKASACPECSCPAAYNKNETEDDIRVNAEKIFYDKDNVKVTNSRLIIDNETYPVFNITSLSMQTHYRDSAGILILLGIGFTIFAITLIGASIDKERIEVGVAGISSLIASYILFKLSGRNVKYSVTLRTSGSEMIAYKSKNKEKVSQIVSKINEAIAY